MLLCKSCHSAHKLCAGLHSQSDPGTCEKCGRGGQLLRCRMPDEVHRKLQISMYRSVQQVTYQFQP